MPVLRRSSEIGAEIKRLREGLSLTQDAFARAAGTSQSRLSKWENADDTYVFEIDSLERVARVAKVPVSVFMEEEPATPLTISEVAGIRDKLRELQRIAGGVLATIEAALSSDRDPEQQAAEDLAADLLIDSAEPEPARDSPPGSVQGKQTPGRDGDAGASGKS